MNKTFVGRSGRYFLHYWVVWAVLLLLSCNGPANPKDPGNQGILQAAPFSALTDSIRQTSPAAAAGLYFRRGDLLTQNNLHALAAADYKRSWELEPMAMTGLHYASSLSILGRSKEVVALLKEGMKKFPGDGNFPRLLAESYQQSGDTSAAMAVYTMMLSRDSSNFEAWYEKGLLLESAGDTGNALSALKKAYYLQPITTYTLELAHLYAENRNPAALALCDEALKKDTAHELIDPLFIKGIYYSNTGQMAKALAQYDSCTHRDWKFTDAWLEKGIIFFHRKDYPNAMANFQMTIKVSNTYADGYFWIGRVCEATGKKEDALLYYHQAIGLDKDFVEAKQRVDKLEQ